MLFVQELEGVTAVGEKVTEELEAASLAEYEGPPLGHRQKQARTHLDRGVVEEHRVWRGKGPARAEATKTKAYRCSRLTVRYCSEKNISEILFKYSFHEKD